MTESNESEQLAYLKGRWSVEDVRGFLDTPSDVDPGDREAVAEWLFELSVSLSLSDGILILPREDPPPTDTGVYVEIAYVPTIRLCPGKMPGVPWDRRKAVENGQLEQWEAFQQLYPQLVDG